MNMLNIQIFAEVFLIFVVDIVLGYSNLQMCEIKQLARLTKDQRLLHPKNTNGYLEPILQVRVPGTEGSGKVREHFSNFFKTLSPEWKLEFDSFVSGTPLFERVNFTNVIATRDPPGVASESAKRLSLVAHYDSKIEPQGFIGAIDSAVPCALIMYTVKQIDDIMTKAWKDLSKSNLGLEIIFLDGEEAFETWTDEDSIYGARHLADRWSKEFYTSEDGSKLTTRLENIDIFMLLDLLGAANPSIYSFYQNTHWAHNNLREIEKKVRKEKLSKMKRSEPKWFSRQPQFAIADMLGDDHVPFFEKGVPILHVIPVPFPQTWHNLNDDGDHLDLDAIHDWSLILTIFVAEYLNLTGNIITDPGLESDDL
jgi:hypothetical protein